MSKAQIELPIAVVIILTTVVVPLLAIVFDVLISATISLSVVILLAALYLPNLQNCLARSTRTMKAKTYKARSIQEALDQIKRELGVSRIPALARTE
jgi:flagellar biosynthesis component FlhA